MTHQEIRRALQRLGMLANQSGVYIRLFVVGGSALALGFNLRESTRDVDAIILAPENHELAKRLIAQVGREMGCAKTGLMRMFMFM